MHCFLCLSPSLSLLAPPCEQTTWFVAGLMGWNVTGYVFICLIWSPARVGGGQEGEREMGGRGGRKTVRELVSTVVIWIHN